MTGPSRPPVTPRDPYGLAPAGGLVGPILAIVGLIAIGLLTITLLIGRLPFSTGGSANDGGTVVPPDATPAPSNVVVVPSDPRADVPGTIAYAKQGSLWLQAGTKATQLTTGGSDSMPAFTSDGTWIYFIRTVTERGLWPNEFGRPSYYTMTYPELMRVAPSGGDPELIVSGRFKKGSLTWFYWLRQPTPNPVDPDVLAVLSDQPDPTKSNVVLQFLDVTTKKYTRAKSAKEVPPLGHQDPAWAPGGKFLLYVMNDKDGRRGAPTIWRYQPSTDKISQATGPGYLAPSFSPDGNYFAATKTTPFGTDIVILDSKTGGEVLRVTSDGESWAPAWSPRGDAIAFLHVRGQIVDLRMVNLTGTAPAFSVKDTIDLTVVSGLDGASRPSWYIPLDQLPTPSPVASPSTGSPAGSPASSASP